MPSTEDKDNATETRKEQNLAISQDMIKGNMAHAPGSEQRDAFSIPVDFDDFTVTHEADGAYPSLPSEQGHIDDPFIATSRDCKKKYEQVYHCFNQLRAVSIEEALKEKEYNKAASSIQEKQLLASKINKEISAFRDEFYIYGNEDEIQGVISSYENSKLINEKKIKKIEEDENSLIKKREEQYENPLSVHASDAIYYFEEKKKIENKIDELKKSNINDESEINKLRARLTSLGENIVSQKDTVNFYGEEITKINDKIKKLQTEKDKIKIELIEFENKIEKLKKIDLLISEYNIVISTVDILEKNNLSQRLFLDDLKIKKENSFLNYKNELKSFEERLQQLQLDFDNLEESATQAKKKGWTKKINYVFSNRKDGTYFQNKIINNLREQYSLLIQWTENEILLINAEIKDAISSLGEKNTAHFNSDNLANLAEEIKLRQKKIKQKLNDQTNKLEKTIQKYSHRVLSVKSTVDSKKNTDSWSHESLSFSTDIADAAVADSHNETFDEDEHISFSLSKSNNKLSRNKEQSTFEWTPASVNKQKNIETQVFLQQPFKKNKHLIVENQAQAEMPIAEEKLNGTSYYDYLDENDGFLSENENKVIIKAATFLKDLTRIGNFYQIEYGICPLIEDSSVERDFNKIIERILLLLRRNSSKDITLYSKAILLFLLKSYFFAKQTDSEAVSSFTKLLEQWHDDSFEDRSHINSFIQRLEESVIPDSPQTLVAFEQYYQNEPLYAVFFSEHVGQWAAAPIRIDLRSAVKLMNNNLDVKFSSEDKGENSEKSSILIKLRLDPTQKKSNQQVLFDFTLQNIEVLNCESPEETIIFPHDAKATVRHVYSQNSFVQQGDIRVTGVLKPFVDYYQKRKKAYRSSLSDEAIQSIVEGAEYKDIQKYPLAKEDKAEELKLKNTLIELFSKNNSFNMMPEQKNKKSRSTFVPSMAKIKSALGATAKKLISRRKNQKKPIQILPLENQADIEIEEKAKKGFFANSIFSRRKAGRINQKKPGTLISPNISKTRAVEKEVPEKRKNSYLDEIVEEASRLPAYIQKKQAKGKRKVNSLVKNLAHWSKLKTKAFHRTFEPLADNNAFVCQIKLENEEKSAGEFLVFPESDTVQATGENCNKLIYKEMLTVLMGQVEVVQARASDLDEPTISLIIVNVSANLKPERIAEIFKAVIKQNCVPTLTGEAIAQAKCVLSLLDTETARRMTQLIEMLEYEQRAEYDELNQPVVPSLEKALSASPVF